MLEIKRQVTATARIGKLQGDRLTLGVIFHDAT